MKKILLFVCPALVMAKGELGMGLGEKWDSDLPQNTSNYSAWTLTPSLWVKQQQKLPWNLTWGNTLRSSAEYLEHRRDPLLNDPILSFNTWMEWKFKKISYRLSPGLGLYVDPELVLVKRSLRQAHDLKYQFKSQRVGLAIDLEQNAYGDTLRNALNLDGALQYQWKCNRPWLEQIAMSGGYSQNLASSDTSSYDSKFVKLQSDWKLGKFKIGLEVERAWKDYKGLYADIRTADSLYQHNDYWNHQVDLELELPWNLSLKTALEYRWKESNIPLYSYRRWLVGGGAYWSYEW